MLYQIFNKAEANDLGKKNPVRFAEKMRKRPPNRKEAFTAEEVKLLLENLPETKSSPLEVYKFITLSSGPSLIIRP